jgi:hypothetical protein
VLRARWVWPGLAESKGTPVTGNFPRESTPNVAQATDAAVFQWKHYSMDTLRSPRVISADRMDGGLIISFDDGQCGIYSAALLFAALPQAEQVESDGELGQRPPP